MNGNVLKNYNYFKSNWINYSTAAELDKKKVMSHLGRDFDLCYWLKKIFRHQHSDICKENRRRSDSVIEILSTDTESFHCEL